MLRPILVRFTMLLTALCAAPAQAQTNAWSMAAQMRVQMQWQRQTMVQQRALILTQIRTEQQQLKMQQQAARSLKPRAPKQPSLARVKKSSTPAASSRTTATKKTPATKPVKTSAQTTQKSPSTKSPSTKVRKTASLSRAGLSLALARNRAGMGLRNLLPRPSALNAGRLSQAKPAGGSSSAPSPSAAAGSGSQTSPTQPGNAADPAPDSPLPAETPAPNPPQADQPPAVVDAPHDASSPLMHKATDATADSQPTKPQHHNDEKKTSFFVDSIPAPSESAGKSHAGESGIMRLVSAIAAGKTRPPVGMETVSIQPDRVWQAPPLPMLQPRHPVSPLLAVD